MRVRTLAVAASIGLFALSAPAAAPAHAAVACDLTVSNLYMSIGMQTASARLSGGCAGGISIVMEQATLPGGPFHEVDTLYHLQQSADGTRALAYFTDPEQRGQCRAKATAQGLTAYSPSTVSC